MLIFYIQYIYITLTVWETSVNALDLNSIPRVTTRMTSVSANPNKLVFATAFDPTNVARNENYSLSHFVSRSKLIFIIITLLSCRRD